MDQSKHHEPLSEFQALYYSTLLRLRQPKWEQNQTNRALIEARIDAIPHQVEAAMFAFRNPFAGGVILADEVGLGKTIETGLILSQMWAEGKRSFLIISPKSLRHQWKDELKSLFYLESEIIDTSTYRKIKNITGATDPFSEKNKVIITNEHFVEKFPEAVRSGQWDLVIIDEAHKLRNAWKTGKNEAKRAKAIRRVIEPYRKLLLTATPIQNNLMELYGLVSFIDPLILGTQHSFQRVFRSIPDEVKEERFQELKSRMSKFFKRELRKNVNSFIRYTVRNPITITYNPSDEEEELREKFEEYIRSPDSIAIPASASHLLRLVYFKLLASSSFALKNSLLNLYKRLMIHAALIKRKDIFESLELKIQKALTLEGNRKAHELENFEKKLYRGIRKKNYEGLIAEFDKGALISDLIEDDEEIAENYDETDIESAISEDQQNVIAAKLLDESDVVLNFILLSRKISENKKAKALITTLEKQFERARNEGWPEKAVIFTEFRATQDYVITALESLGLDLDKDVVIFNGSSGDADSRKKLVEEFKGTKKVFLTTEAGAEGLNLQCANLIINYDLPWNPQRIEQRIGRCHRYGQKLDVVVVNFVNEKNVADQRVLELLQEKFNLFKGAFGASDEILGLIESGTDFEREIFKIYLNCRSENEIRTAFDELLEKNRDLVDEKMRELKENIVNSFDEEVQKKLRVLHEKTVATIGTIQSRVRDIVLSSLPKESFEYDGKILRIKNESKMYSFDKSAITDEVELVHINSHLVDRCIGAIPKHVDIDFCYTGRHNISLVAPLVGKSGKFALYKASLSGIDEKEILVPIFLMNDGLEIDSEISEKLVGITSKLLGSIQEPEKHLFEEKVVNRLAKEFTEFNEYHEALYDEEIEKLEKYFEDVQELKRYEIDDVQKEIDLLKKERNSLPFKAKKEVNSKIQKLKDKQASLEDEISALRHKSRDEEKSRTRQLQDLGEVKQSLSLVCSGSFRIS